MTLYESNYIRLRWLVPDVEAVCGTLVSQVAHDCPLYLTLEERSRYTSTLTLTYLFDAAPGALADPDLQIRVYHDARLAEVRACAPLASARHPAIDSLGARAQSRGSMVAQYHVEQVARYCAERGHRFPNAELAR